MDAETHIPGQAALKTTAAVMPVFVHGSILDASLPNR